jgi:hypothetical protein
MGPGAECARYPVEPWVPENLTVWIDENRTSEMGADDLLAAHYAVGRLEDALLKPQYWREDRFWAKAGGFGYRFARMVWIDEPATFYASVIQHEYFGHGYRGREFGYPRIRYEIGAPPPLGGGGGKAYWTYPYKQGFSLDQFTTVAMAGVEAEEVEADRLRLAWMRSGSLDAHGARLYFGLRSSLRRYLDQTDESVLRDSVTVRTTNDMLNYIRRVNYRKAGFSFEDWPLHLKRIEAQDNWALIDPFLWYSVWGAWVEHLWKAKAFFRYPAIPLGPVRFLPAIGYGLGPWGPEYRWEGLFGWETRALILGYRVGDDTFRRSYGFDAVSSGLMRAGGCVFDLDAHLWEQPRLGLAWADTLPPAPRRAGWSAALNGMSPILPIGWPLRVAAGAGWKTSGYVRGKDLGKGAYWRFGLAWTPGALRAEPSGG